MRGEWTPDSRDAASGATQRGGDAAPNADPLVGPGPRGFAILSGHDLYRKTGSHFCGIMHQFRPKGTARAAVRLVRMYLSASRLPTRGDILAQLRLLPSMGRRQRSSEPAVARKPLHCHGGASIRTQAWPEFGKIDAQKDRIGSPDAGLGLHPFDTPGSAPELVEPGGGAAAFRPASRAGDPFDPRIPANGWVGAEPLGTGSLHHPARPASSFSRLGRGTQELPRHRNRFPQGQVGLKPGVPRREATRMTIGAAGGPGITSPSRSAGLVNGGLTPVALLRRPGRSEAEIRGLLA